MYPISIISFSIRIGRESNNVALYFQKYFKINKLVTVEILDLKQPYFPIFEERLKNLKSPSLEALEFKNKIIASDGIIIVSTEYNGSIPSSLKNVVDLLFKQWQKRIIAFSTVSFSVFISLQILMHLQFIFWKIVSILLPKIFQYLKFRKNLMLLEIQQTRNKSMNLVRSL